MTVDVHSDDFKCLPLEIQHELIVAIQDEYKVNRLRIKPELPDVRVRCVHFRKLVSGFFVV